jgi:hypothetical protein
MAEMPRLSTNKIFYPANVINLIYKIYSYTIIIKTTPLARRSFLQAKECFYDANYIKNYNAITSKQPLFYGINKIKNYNMRIAKTP